MAFLQELKDLQRKVLADMADEAIREDISAFQQYVITSLQTMKKGIYNEFRQQVVGNPHLQQYVVIRSIYPNTPRTLTGMSKIHQYNSAFSELLAVMRAEFPECIVSARRCQRIHLPCDEGLRIAFTIRFDSEP